MQCTTCGTTLPDGTVYCYSCGSLLTTAMPSAAETGKPTTIQGSTGQEQPPVTARSSAAPPLSDNPYMEAGWTEFGATRPPAIPTVSPYTQGSVPAPAAPAPGSYGPFSPYPYPPAPLPPGFVPPMAPMPPAIKRRGLTPAIIALLGGLVVLLVLGSVFIGISIGQAHNSTTTTQTATAGANTHPDQLYQQVMGKTPVFVDSLQDATISPWAVFEKPTYGCEMKSDGLHLHISDSGRYTYCTSGRGAFSNFAFQVQMQILSGSGGGLVFRTNAQVGDAYYFHIFPNGAYYFYIDHNHTLTSLLRQGNSSSFSTTYGAKNTLTVIALANQFYLYVNQQFLTKVQDSTYSSGNVGVAVSDSDGAAEVVYTNARLWIL